MEEPSEVYNAIRMSREDDVYSTSPTPSRVFNEFYSASQQAAAEHRFNECPTLQPTNSLNLKQTSNTVESFLLCISCSALKESTESPLKKVHGDYLQQNHFVEYYYP